MSQTRTILFWNVERLFTSTNNVIGTALATKDVLTEKQIDQKIGNIAAVIDSISKKVGPPLLVGLVEVQTQGLAKKIAKSVKSVQLVNIDDSDKDMFMESLDAINITLLYDKSSLGMVEKVQSHVVDRTFETRDILEVKFSQNKEHASLTVFVSHWPSRLSAEGNNKRISAAYYLRNLITNVVRFPMSQLWDVQKNTIKMPSISELQRKARSAAIIMGDFNDEPFNESIEVLRTITDVTTEDSELNIKGENTKEKFRNYISSIPYLINPYWRFIGTGGGTYYRSPNWRIYDQIMFTHGFVYPFEHEPFYQSGDAYIYNEKDVIRPDGVKILLTNTNGKPISFNPSSGNGCSDHFCIYIKVKW